MSIKLTTKVLVDIGMTITMLISFTTGMVLWLVIPSGRGSGWSVFLGLNRHLWNSIHTYSSLVFGAILLIHLALNWRLFWSMARCIFRTRYSTACPG